MASSPEQILQILKNIEDIEIVKLSGKDVVRNRLVQEIIKAYEKNQEKR